MQRTLVMWEYFHAQNTLYCLTALCVCFLLGLECLSTSIPSAPSIPMSRRRFPFPSPSALRGYPGLLLSLCWPHYLPSHCFQDVFPLDSVLPTDRQCILWGDVYTVYTVKWMDMCGKEPESELINSLHHLLPSSTVNYKTGSSAL